MTSPTPVTASADAIFFNGKIATQDDKRSFVTALAVKDGKNSRHRHRRLRDANSPMPALNVST